MRFTRICFALSILSLAGFAAAQDMQGMDMAKMAPKKTSSADAAYIAKALVGRAEVHRQRRRRGPLR